MLTERGTWVRVVSDDTCAPGRAVRGRSVPQPSAVTTHCPVYSLDLPMRHSGNGARRTCLRGRRWHPGLLLSRHCPSELHRARFRVLCPVVPGLPGLVLRSPVGVGELPACPRGSTARDTPTLPSWMSGWSDARPLARWGLLWCLLSVSTLGCSSFPHAAWESLVSPAARQHLPSHPGPPWAGSASWV